MTRARFERICRLLAVTALVLAVLDLAARAMGRGVRTRVRIANAVTLPGDTTGANADSSSQRALTTFTRAAASKDSLTLMLRGVPSAQARAAIGAARAAGVGVRWYAPDSPSAIALQVESARGATEGAVVRASIDAATTQSPRRVRASQLRDDGGVLDSSAAAVRAWRLAQRAPGLAYTAPGVVARATEAASKAGMQRVLLGAAPGWEAKFAAAALEEAGWSVDGRFTLSPSSAVTLGNVSKSSPLQPRTDRHDVVVLLDSVPPAASAIDTRMLDRFVRDGGGVVFAGDALRGAAARTLAPVHTIEANVRGGVVGALRTPLPRLGLDAWRLIPERDAIVLQADTIDGRTIAPSVVARRHGAGRVVATAYRETWRWRMEGTDAGLAEHRAWWDRVLAAAAGRPVTQTLTAANAGPYPGSAAPWADLVARAGAPSVRASTSAIAKPQRTWPDRQAILYVVAALALLCEWASRRLRGLP